MDQIRGRFSWERALLDSDLDTPAKALGLALATYVAASQPTAFPSVARLASDISRSERTVQRLLALLRDERYLSSEPRYTETGRQMSTLYTLTAPTQVTQQQAERAQKSDESNVVTATSDVIVIRPGEGDTHDTPEGDTHDTPLTDHKNTNQSSLRYTPTRLAQPGLNGEGNLTPAQTLIAWWVDHQTIAPAQSDVGKQAGVAKRLVQRYGKENIRLAVAGMGHLYPYSDGEPWDLFDLERKFLKAVQSLITTDPRFKAQRDREQILKSIKEAGQ